jgi:peptidoglycan/LPS O-acetylase OafA/YrhL
MNNDQTERKYYPALDGLRGIAILLVLLAHHFDVIPYFPILGPCGVDLFFVLSGFLITDILLRSRGKAKWLQSFFINRVLRIFPVYYLVLLIYFLISPYLDPDVIQYNYYHAHWEALVFHFNNFLIVFYPNHTEGRIFGHFWSLSVEEQFYLFWPFAVLLFSSKHSLVFLLITIILIAIGIRLYAWYSFRDAENYWGAMTNLRFDAIAPGALLAALRYEYPTSRKKKFISFSVLIFIIYAILIGYKYFYDRSFSHYLTGGITAFCMCAGLAIIFGIEERAQRSWLANRPLVFFGKISYGLYIFHFPLLLIARHYAIKYFGNEVYTHLISGAITAILAVLLSFASYHWFERRFLAMKISSAKR